MNAEDRLDELLKLVAKTGKPHYIAGEHGREVIDPQTLIFSLIDPELRYSRGPEWIRCDED